MTDVYSEKMNREPEMVAHQKLRLTEEEMRILRECNKESFYYRCLPFAASAMATTYLAVKRGILKPNPKYGVTLKLMGAGFFGWFVGKMSYRSKCEEKFLNLQNSKLADAIRKKRGFGFEGFNQEIPQSDTEMVLNPDDSLSYSLDDAFSTSSYSTNQDAGKSSQYSDADEREKADYPQGEDRISRSVATYDDLRQRNREEYEQRQLRLYQPSPSSPRLPPVTQKEHDYSQPKTQGRQNAYESGSTGKKNIYGDSWDK